MKLCVSYNVTKVTAGHRYIDKLENVLERQTFMTFPLFFISSDLFLRERGQVTKLKICEASMEPLCLTAVVI